MLTHGNPHARRVGQRLADVTRRPVEDCQVLGAILVRDRIVEEVIIEAQKVNLLIQAAEHAPVDIRGVAQHVVVGLEGNRHAAVVVEDRIIHAAFDRVVAAVNPLDRVVEVRRQAVE